MQSEETRLKAVDALRYQYSLLVDMELTHDFQKFVQKLNGVGAEYIIAGGFAVALYGYPRYTGGIDIWINPVPANAAKVLQVLQEMGYSDKEVNLEDLTTIDVVVQLVIRLTALT
ncbi:hypothetical protein GCM10028895_20420 [Pontibacter rugosus]